MSLADHAGLMQNSEILIVSIFLTEVSGKTIHLFNIEGKAFVSTGELAKKFTDFSTCDTLVRVLKNKDISIPYKKLTRQEGLPLFSALDGYMYLSYVSQLVCVKFIC